MTSKNTKRVPLSRKIRRSISAKAVAAYEYCCLHQDAYLACNDDGGSCKTARLIAEAAGSEHPPRCAPCTTWLARYWAMHRDLGLSPWVCIASCDDDPPEDGSGGEAYWRACLEAALAKAVAAAPQFRAGIEAALRGELPEAGA